MTSKSDDTNLLSQLHNLQEVLNVITDMMPDRHFIVNEKGFILSRFGNASSDQFYHLDNDQPQSIAQLTTAENTKKSFSAIKEAIATQNIITFETSSKLSDLKILMPKTQGPNSKQWFEIRVRKLEFLIDNENVLIFSIRNVTDKKLSEIKLNEMAITDPLTKLFNRRYVSDELTRCLQRYLRYKTDISVLILDIDFFKKINDNYGHDIGDIILIKLSEFLQSNVRSADTIARIGGEEFLIIMPDVALQTTESFCNRLINKIKTLEILTPSGALPITVSGGLSQFTDQDNNIETLLKRIDVALYCSKNEGRNRITVA